MGQNAYFDIRVTNPSTNSKRNQPIEKVLNKIESEKKQQYNDRIMHIEHGTFTHWFFALNGGFRYRMLNFFHTHLADRIASKAKEKYDSVLNWIRCKISFMVYGFSFMLCIRGSRSFKNGNSNNIPVVDDFQLACDDARFILTIWFLKFSSS